MRVRGITVVSKALPALLLVGLMSASQAQTAPATTVPQATAPQTPPATATTPTNATTPAKKPVWKVGDNCVTDDEDVRVELQSGRHPAGGQILIDTYFLPAGTTVEMVLSEPFDAATRYFAYIQRDKSHRSFLGRNRVSSSQVPETHSL